MPYEVMLKEAHSLIDEIPRDKIGYVVTFLKSANGLYGVSSSQAKKRKAGEVLMSFAGALRKDFDEKAELDEWREERFGSSDRH